MWGFWQRQYEMQRAKNFPTKFLRTPLIQRCINWNFHLGCNAETNMTIIHRFEKIILHKSSKEKVLYCVVYSLSQNDYHFKFAVRRSRSGIELITSALLWNHNKLYLRSEICSRLPTLGNNKDCPGSKMRSVLNSIHKFWSPIHLVVSLTILSYFAIILCLLFFMAEKRDLWKKHFPIQTSYATAVFIMMIK